MLACHGCNADAATSSQEGAAWQHTAYVNGMQLALKRLGHCQERLVIMKPLPVLGALPPVIAAGQDSAPVPCRSPESQSALQSLSGPAAPSPGRSPLLPNGGTYVVRTDYMPTGATVRSRQLCHHPGGEWRQRRHNAPDPDRSASASGANGPPPPMSANLSLGHAQHLAMLPPSTSALSTVALLAKLLRANSA